MDDRGIGLQVRALRRRRRWRQSDLAAAAGVSQSLISLLERGHLDAMSVHALRAVLSALDARLEVGVRWRGGALDRLMDERHATLVNLVVAILSACGWTTAVEVSFNHFGDRGSIDVLAWHPLTRTLLVIEVKSEITSIEGLVRRLDVKTRLARQIAAEQRGWRPVFVATLVVLPEGTAARTTLRRFGAVFATTYPARGREIRPWLRHPAAALRGVWLLSPSNRSGGKSVEPAPNRVRLPRSGSSVAA
jgi:transcriptional regulator with XRE-family HTH domain